MELNYSENTMVLTIHEKQIKYNAELPSVFANTGK